MGVVKAKIQTVEDIYRIVWTAILQRQCLAADYSGKRRLVCPHRLGRNAAGKLRVLCYQYGGGSVSGLEPAGSSANWRCIDLERLKHVEPIEGPWRTAPNHSRPQTCIQDTDIDAEG
jgi:hypothetical protein